MNREETQNTDTRIRLLLVEDDAESRLALTLMLERRGVQVTAAASGEKGLQAFTKDVFDIIVADIRMEGMSGLDLLRHIRAADEDYPVILLTAYDSLDSAIQAVRLGAQDYILKPLDSIDDLVEPVKKAVRYHQLLLKNRALEEQLKESEKRYRLSIESAPYGIAVADPAGNVTIFNPAMENITGFFKDDVPALDVWLAEISHGPDGAGFAASAAEARDLRLEELVIRRRDGNARTCQAIYGHLSSGIATLFLADITERKRAENELMTSREHLRALAARLQSIREEERTAISRRIHDELGHAMTGIKLDLAWLTRNVPACGGPNPDVDLADRIKAMTGLLDDAIETTRKIATELRPGLLDHLGLCAAVEWQAKQFETRTGIAMHLHIPDEPLPLTDEQTTALFRIFQETLTNVIRHSKATDVVVKIGLRSADLVVEVLDNGVGIPDDRIESSGSGSLGLLGMRERARLLGGTFSIQGKKGTGVTVRIPVNRQ